MTTALRLAPSLALPVAVAGQTIALVGIRGAGKTNTAGVIAEELLDHQHPIAVIDPTDAWWGLRAGANGDPAGGYPVVIFGGAHADAPLHETDGKVIAEFLVTEHVPVILSLRHLRKGAQRRFVTDLCEELYHLKGKPEHRSPLTVFIDEAPLFVPQRVTGEVARTVGAVEDLIARGRNAGFGVVLVSQRSATISKDVLTQADTIITHRLTSPQDRGALEAWIEENTTLDEKRAVLASLATLQNGEAWVWAPVANVMQRAKIRLRRTFDSSAAPAFGKAAPKTPKRLADVDLDALKRKLGASIDKAKADDPAELRKRIAQLTKELAGKPSIQPATIKEVPVLTDAQLARLEKVYERMLQKAQDYGESMALLWEQQSQEARALLDVLRTVTNTPKPPPATVHQMTGRRPTGRVTTTPVAPNAPTGDPGVTTPQQRILNALRWAESLGLPTQRREKVAFLADASPRSSAFVNNLGALRTKGYIDYPQQGTVALTGAGRALAQEGGDVPTTSEQLQEAVCRKLPAPQARIVRALTAKYPRSTSRAELADEAQASATSSAYVNNLGALRSLGLLEYPEQGQVKASAVLFLDER